MLVLERFRFFSILILLISSLSVKGQIEFIQNKGQWDNKILFKSSVNNGAFFLEKTGFTVALHKPEDLRILSELIHGEIRDTKQPMKDLVLRSHAYKVSYFGGNTNPAVEAGNKQSTYNNYYIGNNPSAWAPQCAIYGEVVYKNVYPNIDVRYYTAYNTLKYDFIVKPGGNPASIGLRYDGAKGLSISSNKLLVHTSIGDVTELEPYSYQQGETSPEKIDVTYNLEDNIVSFKVKNYDKTKTLIIDPSIIFSTFTGSTTDNWGFTATPGPDGSFFAGGISFGTGYPVSTGAYDVTFNGGSGTDGYDIAIMKFSPNGTNRLYATYLGGAGNEQPHSMISDLQGNLVIAGASNSIDYPRTSLQTSSESGNKFDIILTKISASGAALLGSVKIGGSGDDGINISPKVVTPGAISIRRNYGDDARSEVIVDASNNIILSSCTQSTNFPVVGSAIQGTNAGLQDGVIMKLTPNLTSFIFSTYFGGAENDACFVLSINPLNGNIYVGGATESTNLPGDKTGTISSTLLGAADGFVTIISPGALATVVKTTYVGTSNIDLLFGLKFDKRGFPYIMGTTKSSNWPIINAVYSDPGSKQFIAKLQPDLSAYVYSTVFGTAGGVDPNISPIAFLVDICENVYVSGWGGSGNASYSSGSTLNLPETNPLQGIQQADGSDFYFFVLEKNAQSRLFASHFGQFGGYGDHVDGGTSRFDEQGVIYQALCANCTREGIFPTTGGVYAPFNGSPGCNQASVKIDMNFSGVNGQIQSNIGNFIGDTTACVGVAITFRDLIVNAKKLIFDFGDGSPRETIIPPASNVTHTYNVAGTYTVMLIAEDSSTCNIRDTSYINIRVGDNIANLSFVAQKQQPCESLTYSFTNTTTNTDNIAYLPNNFYWDYGDGSPGDTINGFAPNPAMHTYDAPGNYTVKLFLIRDNFCNAPDTAIQEIRINPLVEARFVAPAQGCAPFTVLFDNQSTAGTSFEWQFDTGVTFSTEVNATYTFVNPGTYRVRLIANDPSTCNLTDTSGYFTITVSPLPTANATWSPNPPIENTPVSFTNLSSPDAIAFLWYFGDGDSSRLRNPVHEYNQTGSYDVKLIAYNSAQCTDTFTLTVQVLILPLLDVPNAFTPGRFGENGVIKVRGFGIEKMSWKIYNRWGEMVFSSNSKQIGWDGTYKGKLQPMDVYTYTLDAELGTGEKIRKTGDITLLK